MLRQRAWLGLALTLLALPSCGANPPAEDAQRPMINEPAAAESAPSTSPTAPPELSNPNPTPAASASVSASPDASANATSGPLVAPKAPDALTQRSLAFFVEFTATVEAASGDCDKLGADLNKLTTKNSVLFQQMMAHDKTMTEAQRNDEDKKYDDFFKEMERRTHAPVRACKDNPKVRAALAKMPG